ncbi:hypothetical protein N3K66_005772 [Trichothecium roseum]|uniref:Uncharacterized protein n=1 Tax=Trichothecium roseum TaxID=47278 RepID=A0ACC0UZ34_9HYPO|nr:hypothetical protein N3K66_005772 [Trichothecium roseum]
MNSTAAHQLQPSTSLTPAPQPNDDNNSDTKEEPVTRIESQGGPPPPPNGGYGWVCTACVATINGHTWGLNSSYGVFLAHYLKNDTFPGASPLEYAFVGSLSISIALAISPVATLLVRHIGTKPTMLLGVLLETGSLIAASFATQIWHLFLTQGLTFGLGMGFLFVASVPIVPQWFTTKRSLANGFSSAGSGVGGLIYSFATGAMIKNLGLPWAFRILGIIAGVVNTICTILVKDRNKIIGTTQLAFNVALFKRIEYVLLMLFGWFSMLGYVILIFSLANYANKIGLDSSQAALISAFFNMGQALGRPLVGYFSDRTGRINMSAAMTILAGIFSLTIWINAEVYGALIVFALVGGAVAGTFWTTVGPVTAEVIGLKHVSSGLNLIWLTIMLPCTFSEAIALQIVESTGSYLGTQLFTGFAFIAAGICLIFLRGWKIGETAEISRATELPEKEIDWLKIDRNPDLYFRGKAAGRHRMMKDLFKLKRV